MRIVAGADFGTLSVRVSIFDRSGGRLGSGGGGISRKNHVLNRLYANALKKSVQVPSGDVALREIAVEVRAREVQ